MSENLINNLNVRFNNVPVSTPKKSENAKSAEAVKPQENKAASVEEDDRFMPLHEYEEHKTLGLKQALSHPATTGKQEIEAGRDEQISTFVLETMEPIVTVFNIKEKQTDNDPNVFNIIHTNDLHGKLEPKGDRAGMAYVAGTIDKIRKEDKDFILVDGGDISYAPPYSDRNRFNPMVDIMNDIGYDAVAAGNHEFQWEAGKYDGPDGNPNKNLTDNLKELQADSKFPIICANAVEKKTGQRPEFLKPFIIKKVGNVNVGVVGVVTKSLATQAHPLVGDGWKIQDQSAVLKETIPQMKAEGADIIVVVSHDNLKRNQSLISRTPGIDIMVGGHDHVKVDKPIMVQDPDGNNVPLVEAGSHGYMVGKLQVEVDPKSKELITVTSTLIPVLSSTSKPDPEVQAIVDKWTRK